MFSIRAVEEFNCRTIKCTTTNREQINVLFYFVKELHLEYYAFVTRVLT